MKAKLMTVLAACILLGASVEAQPAPKSYQVTGPIVSLTENTIVVMKDNEKWEIERTPKTKVDGQLKVGAKVTIHYTMSAKSVEVKAK